jgi:MFS family permease
VTEEREMGIRGMLILTLPTLGFSTALSLVTTVLPVILREKFHVSATLIGFAIGGDGIFSLLIPLWVGVLSDRMWTKRWGRRQPFMIFAAPFMAASLMLAPFQTGYVPIVVSTFVFFAAYQFYTSPYQSLLPDVTPSARHGRVQGVQTFMRGGGMFLGVVVAAPLFQQWAPLPFILTSVLIMLFTYLTVLKIREPEPDPYPLPPRGGIGGEMARIWRSIHRDRGIQRFMVASFLWESTLAGLRPFVLLYFINSLRASPQIGGLLFGLVGVTYMVAGLLSGFLADRYGRSRVMHVGLWVYFGGCVFGFFITDIRWAFLFLPIFGLGASIVLTLPYAILIRLMPKEHIGQFTGMFSMVRGLANIVAPVLVGLAIDVGGSFLHQGRQYSVIWIVAALMLAISLYFFRGLRKAEVLNV